MDNIKIIGRDCTGCRACEQSCPKKCISMTADKEGFLYPVVDENDCINCGICLKSCPQQSFKTKHSVKGAFALQNSDGDSLFQSASGGAADAVAKLVLKGGGSVFGAAYNDNLAVQHICVETNDDLRKLRSSKYVQSDTNDSYTRAKQKLLSGQTVLFTGTPCQIAGLYTFLGKDYDNLITLDLICHGVPSPLFFKKEIEYLSKKHGAKITSFNFRSKRKRGWGTHYEYTFYKSGKTVRKTGELELDRYGNHFTKGDCYRECCYNCKYANLNRPADLTAGDFWGVEKVYPRLNSEAGVSCVIANSEKGAAALSSLNAECSIIEAKISDVLVKQHNLKHPTPRPNNRSGFYSDIQSSEFMNNVHTGLELKTRVKGILPRRLIQFLKRL